MGSSWGGKGQTQATFHRFLYEEVCHNMQTHHYQAHPWTSPLPQNQHTQNFNSNPSGARVAHSWMPSPLPKEAEASWMCCLIWVFTSSFVSLNSRTSQLDPSVVHKVSEHMAVTVILSAWGGNAPKLIHGIQDYKWHHSHLLQFLSAQHFGEASCWTISLFFG